MKRKYEVPVVEIVEFETEDVITTSGGNTTQDWPILEEPSAY